MIELQRKLLGDRVRNDALYAALKRVVKPGCVVADIGSGTGFLGFLARKLGAKECFLYESSGDLLALSKKIAKRAGVTHCQFIHAHSTEVKSPVKADIVISETLGNYALEEHLIETMEDAKRFLKPGGTLLPQRLTQWVVPVVDDRLQREIDIWGHIGFGIDLADARDACLQNMYVKTVKSGDLLAAKDATKAWDTLDFRKHEKSQRRGHVQWKLARPVTIHGLCLFWECELLPGITLSTSPWKPLTHWEQIYLPLLAPIDVKSGETLDLILTSDTRYATGVRVTWEAAIVDAKGKRCLVQMMDTKKGCI